jgi:hypothetical protein
MIRIQDRKGEAYLTRSTLVRRFVLVDLPFRETPSRRRLPAFHKHHLDYAA